MMCSLLIDFSRSLKGLEELVYSISSSIYDKLLQYCIPPVTIYVLPGDHDVYKVVSPYELERYLKSGAAEGPSPLAEAILKVLNEVKSVDDEVHIFVLTDGYQYAGQYRMPDLEDRGMRLRKEIKTKINISILLLWRCASAEDPHYLGSRKDFGKKLGAILFDSINKRNLLRAMIESGIEGEVREGNIVVNMWKLIPDKSALDRIDDVVRKTIAHR